MMAPPQKIQGEIEYYLSKVAESIAIFDRILQDLNRKSNPVRKKKLDKDLSKEVEKLQRFQTRIEEWINGNEVKYRAVLLKNRELIDTKLELISTSERGTTVKSPSKEKVIPVQKASIPQNEEEMMTWLVDAINTLNIQVDKFEIETETLLNDRKNTTGSEVDGCDPEIENLLDDKEKTEHEVDRCDTEIEILPGSNTEKTLTEEEEGLVNVLIAKIEKHRFHIEKLKTISWMLEKKSVDINQMHYIHHYMERYITTSDEGQSIQEEDIYEEMDRISETISMSSTFAGSAGTDDNHCTPTSRSSSPSLQQPSVVSPSTDSTHQSTNLVMNDVLSKLTPIPASSSAENPITVEEISKNYNNILCLVSQLVGQNQELSKKFDRICDENRRISLENRRISAENRDFSKKYLKLDGLVYLKEVSKSMQTTFERAIASNIVKSKLKINAEQEKAVIKEFEEFKHAYKQMIQIPRNDRIHKIGSLQDVDRKRIEKNIVMFLKPAEIKNFSKSLTM